MAGARVSKVTHAVHREIGPDKDGFYTSEATVNRMKTTLKKHMKKRYIANWPSHKKNVIKGALNPARTTDDNLTFKYKLGDLLK